MHAVNEIIENQAAWHSPDIDISSNQDRSILKHVIRRGNVNKGHPEKEDTLEIAWKIYVSMNESLKLVHNSDKLDER